VFRSLGATGQRCGGFAIAGLARLRVVISITERAAAYEEWSRTRLGDFSERVQRRLHLGALVSGVDYVQAVRRRRELRSELQAAMRDLDVVITAGAPGEAARMDADTEMGLFDKPNFTMPFNVTGYPALCVCSASVRAVCRSAFKSSASRFRSDGAARRRCVRKGNGLAIQAAGDGGVKGY